MRIVFICILTLVVAYPLPGTAQERPDWGSYFEEFGAQGTIVIVDEREGSPIVDYSCGAAIHECFTGGIASGILSL